MDDNVRSHQILLDDRKFNFELLCIFTTKKKYDKELFGVTFAANL